MESSYTVSSETARKARRIVAESIGGKEIRRTTTLPLSHYWQTQFSRSDTNATGGMSGFASSERRARKAAFSETNRVRKFLRSEGVHTSEPYTYIVPVREE